MTILEKQVILSEITRILDNLVITAAPAEITQTVSDTSDDDMPQLLTIKECTEIFKGLTENTLRQLIARKEIHAVRTGEGKRGKILVEKNTLIRFLSGT